MNKLNLFLDNAKLLQQGFGIRPLLYGSLGLEVLLQIDLASNDIDILIPECYLKEKWELFKGFLEYQGYQLIDLHEHTFIKNEVKFSYASIENLESFAGIKVEDIPLCNDYLLLNKEQYLKVYQTSMNDGYRINHKHKKDQEKIDILNSFLKVKRK